MVMAKLFMLLFPFNRKKSDKMIFSLKVEFNSEFQKQFGNLRKDKIYSLVNSQDNIRFSSEDAVQEIENVIKILPDEIYGLLGYETKIRINSIEYGSITVIFTVLAAVYFGISRYKNFIESCELIQKHLKRLLEKAFKRRFSQNPFDIDIHVEYPNNSSVRSFQNNKISIEGIGLILTAITIFLTFLSLRDTQKWKTAEFTAVEYRKFRDIKSVRLVEQMLDWKKRNIPELTEDTVSQINIDTLLEKSLDTLQRIYNTKEQKVRDAFDEYLDELSLFNRYLETNLMKFKQIKPYLNYYVSIIGDKSNEQKSPQARQRIWDYIKKYGFTDVEKLLLKFGYDINS
jgi:hypothetical protein